VLHGSCICVTELVTLNHSCSALISRSYVSKFMLCFYMYSVIRRGVTMYIKLDVKSGLFVFGVYTAGGRYVLISF
jgi:hypothetical protein